MVSVVSTVHFNYIQTRTGSLFHHLTSYNFMQGSDEQGWDCVKKQLDRLDSIPTKLTSAMASEYLHFVILLKYAVKMQRFKIQKFFSSRV